MKSPSIHRRDSSRWTAVLITFDATDTIDDARRRATRRSRCSVLGLSTGAARVADRRRLRSRFPLPHGRSPYGNRRLQARVRLVAAAVHRRSAAASAGSAFSRGGSWSRDYPKADITFLAALRRLTRVDARSYQQVVNLDSDDIFNYPFVYAVQVAELDLHRAAGQAPARLPAQGRLPHGGRFPRHRRLGKLPARHADGAAGRQLSDFRPRRRRRNLSRAVRHRPALSGAGRAVRRRRDAPTKRTATSRSGAPSATTRAASSWPSATTCTWATPGNGPTTRSIRSRSRRWRFASASTTSCTA